MLVYVVLSCLFLAALWSPAGKGLTSCCRVCYVFLCFFTFPNVSWFTSELRARLAPWNWFNPSSKIIILTVQRRYFFCESIVFFCVLCSHAFGSVHCCLVVTLWDFAFVGDVDCILCYFPMWYPGSGVVLDCIVSWTLSFFLLLLMIF